MSLAALAFPPRPLSQPEGKHRFDLLGSRPALGGQVVGDTNRKINGLSFRCFRALRTGEGQASGPKVQPVSWGMDPGRVVGISPDPCQGCVCPLRAPRAGPGSLRRRTPEGRPMYLSP